MIVITGKSLRVAGPDHLDAPPNMAMWAIENAQPRRFEFDGSFAGDRPVTGSTLALAACEQAWADSAGCVCDDERIGSTVTASKLGLAGLLESMSGARTEKDRGKTWLEFMTPLLSPPMVRGPVVTSVGACTTGLCSWVRAVSLLEHDEADAVFAGAVEETLHDFVVGGFRRMGVLSSTRPRPFDFRRDGFVPAEGVGIVVLEREEDAVARGARIHARIRGACLASDPTHAVATTPDGSSIVALVEKTLRRADMAAADISYVHLHGTGTRQNDVAESAALRKLFDERGLFVPASSTKGSTGHCLGAAGAVEAILTFEALSAAIAPGTAGLETIDDECRSECIIAQSQPLNGKVGLVLSYGFGGHLAALLIEAAS